MEIYEILSAYKKLVRKNFFNKMLGVALSSSPKRNQITGKIPHLPPHSTTPKQTEISIKGTKTF